jgi:hypothetical protein
MERIVFEGDFPISKRYLVSTDVGLFRAERNAVCKLSASGGFGLAISGDCVYLAATDAAG